MQLSMETKELLAVIKDAAYEVRLNLTAGFLESVYQDALMIELSNRGLHAEKEAEIPVWYKGEKVGDFRADILVENRIILELKAVNEINALHEAQLVNYLVATGLDYGYLINYGANKFRIVLKSRIYKPTFDIHPSES